MSEAAGNTKSSDQAMRLSTCPFIGKLRRAGFPIRHLRVDPAPDESAWSCLVASLFSTIGDGVLFAVVGPRGTGKTQAAVSAAKAVERRYDDHLGVSTEARTRYTTAVELFMAIKETYGENAQRSERAAVDAFVKPMLLIIDEVQERAGTEWEQRLLAAIVDRRYAAMKDTILVGNLKPDDVQRELGTSICSRAQETGGIYVADWPSFRARKAGGAA